MLWDVFKGGNDKSVFMFNNYFYNYVKLNFFLIKYLDVSLKICKKSSQRGHIGVLFAVSI